MKNTNKLILLSAMLVWAMLPATAFSITKEQQVDLRLLEAQKAYKIKDYSGAVKAFEAIEKLNVNMEAEYYFFYASAENNNGNAEKAFTLVNKYLEISGQNGQYYQQALALYLDAEEKQRQQKAAEQQRIAVAEEKQRQQKAAEQQRIAAAEEKQRQQKAAEQQRIAVAEQQRIAVAEEKQRQQKAAEQLVPVLIAQMVHDMIDIPAGSFQIGSNDGRDNEKPIHGVSISAFKMSQTEVTFAQWDACVTAKGCSYQPSDNSRGRGNLPVYNVSYDAITQQFLPWLNKTTGTHYRLPTEAEWEYAARSGSSTKYSWGNSISCSQVIYDGCDNNIFIPPVKSFLANAFGLYDMHGSVWEWTQDCWNDSYSGASSDGRAWTNGDCSKRVVRGGASNKGPHTLRSAFRVGVDTFVEGVIGFRLVQGS